MDYARRGGPAAANDRGGGPRVHRQRRDRLGRPGRGHGPRTGRGRGGHGGGPGNFGRRGGAVKFHYEQRKRMREIETGLLDREPECTDVELAPEIDYDYWINTREAGEILGVGATWVRELAKRHGLRKEFRRLKPTAAFPS